MLQDTKQQIRALVQKYERDRDFYRSLSFNETELRNQFLDPLFEALGWDIRNVSCRSTTEREVLLEEPLKESALTHSKKPDYTFRLYGERKFFLEAKKPCVLIENENEPAKQVRRYGFTAGLKISVLSNFEHLFIYDTSTPVEVDDLPVKYRIKEYHYTSYEDHAEDLLKYLGRESVYCGQFDLEWQDIMLNVEHKSVDKLFLDQINSWRLMLGKEIYLYEPSLDADNLGDIVQSYINKILFLRVCEDRNIEKYQSLLRVKDRHSDLIRMFKEADQRYNSGLFEEQLSEKIIENISSSFWEIIRQLYYPESPYSFAVLSSDILGQIYEIFLAQKIVIQNGEVVVVNKPENLERDIVTTPNYIVREILDQIVPNVIEGKTDSQIITLQCADIACGSGAFLLELFQQLCDALVVYYVENDPSKLIQTNIDSYKLTYEAKCNLLTKCIYGVDKDYNAVQACKFGLLLKLLEGETLDTLPKGRSILPKLDDNIFYGNSLLSKGDVPKELWAEINPYDFGGRGFDLIVGNPPYMKTEDIKKFTPAEKGLYEKRYMSAYQQYDKYFLFVERALGLLNSGGYIGYIIPSKFMKVESARKLREHIANGKFLKGLTLLGAHQIFEDKSTYTCIVVLQKEYNEQFYYLEVEQFAKWRIREREARTLTYRESHVLSDEPWIICTDKKQQLLDKLTDNASPLLDIVGRGNIFNGIQTSASKIYVFEPEPIASGAGILTFKVHNKIYQIEERVTKSYFKTIQGEEALSTYRTFKPNARVIFPYIKAANGKLQLMPLSFIRQSYPLLYKFLSDFKSELAKPSRNIQPSPVTPDEWYRYGRHQGLEACDIKEKIIVGVLAQSGKGKYAVDTQGTLVSSGGTAGYCMISRPANCKYSIYYIQALLASRQGEWLATLYGEVFQGGYIARGTKVLKQIPIRTINFNDLDEVSQHNEISERQKKLIALGEQIANAGRSPRDIHPLKREFEVLKDEQQKAIDRLYKLTDEEASSILII